MTAIEFQYRLINLQGSLVGFAYRLTADKDDAKDLVQDTFRDQTKESFYINKTEASDSENAHSVYSAVEITQHLEKLEDASRLPLRMRVDGYKYKEIADKLNLNIGTVKSRIFQSRRQLMNQLNR